MRSDVFALRVTGVAVALTALSAVTAPFAFAEEDWNRDRGSVSADPNPAEPGAQVKLRVRGCDEDWAVASSVVFVSEVRLSTGRDDRRTLWGDAMIRSWAEPGRHDIKIKCGGRGGEREWGTIEIERRREHRPDPHRTPIWPVHAGGGGMSEEIAAKSKAAGSAEAAKAADSAQLAAATKKSHDGDGPGLPHTVIGAVLAAAATLAVAGRALTLRRRRSGE